jgi:hypothetical protein
MKTRFCLLLGVLLWGAHLFAEQIPVYDVAAQPLAAQAKRLVTAMDLLGEPFDAKTKAELAKAAKAAKAEETKAAKAKKASKAAAVAE